jgi:hypothetical protein
LAENLVINRIKLIDGSVVWGNLQAPGSIASGLLFSLSAAALIALSVLQTLA